jgi:hypothetical protein
VGKAGFDAYWLPELSVQMARAMARCSERRAEACRDKLKHAVWVVVASTNASFCIVLGMLCAVSDQLRASSCKCV